MAQTGVGRRVGTDGPRCRQRCRCPTRGTKRRAQRYGVTMGTPIQVRGLSAWFGERQALESINLDVQPNHATAIIGPSGCGKSTFVRCLNRMHETVPGTRVEGMVKLGETNVYGDGSSPVEVRRKVGMVFQKPNPFPTMSIYDNVAA